MSNSRSLQSDRPAGNQRVIGVFDSGVGGLTVLRALIERIPGANYLYFGDTARLPYGSKSAATVAHYAVDAVRYLQDQGAELLVIACNTATALALDEIKRAASVPVIGVIEPGADAAAKASKKKHAVVIGTEATVASHAYRRALETRNVRVREKACPLFVPLVEEQRFIWRKPLPQISDHPKFVIPTTPALPTCCCSAVLIIRSLSRCCVEWRRRISRSSIRPNRPPKKSLAN